MIDTAKEVIEHWLAVMGLHLKPSKTRIVHTLESVEDQGPGFDFLGFTVRQYPVGKYRSGLARTGQPLGFKTLITPSKEAVQRHYAALRAIVVTGRTLAHEVLIAKLNPVIRGWSQYYRTIVAKTTFSDLDNRLFPLLLHWAKRRHRNKNGHWIYARYWRTEGRDRWCFAPPAGARLLRHTSTRIQRHVKVRGTASPYDGNLLYWARRLHHSPLLSGRLARLLKQQDGACARCGLLFTDQSQCEIDHIDPTGTDALANLQLLHRHCHDQKTAADYAAGQYASQAPRVRGAG